jgi:hypothetical protein
MKMGNQQKTWKPKQVELHSLYADECISPRQRLIHLYEDTIVLPHNPTHNEKKQFRNLFEEGRIRSVPRLLYM